MPLTWLEKPSFNLRSCPYSNSKPGCNSGDVDSEIGGDKGNAPPAPAPAPPAAPAAVAAPPKLPKLPKLPTPFNPFTPAAAGGNDDDGNLPVEKKDGELFILFEPKVGAFSIIGVDTSETVEP